MLDPLPVPVAQLRSLATVRRRAHVILNYVQAGASPYFRLHEARLPDLAVSVADLTRETYPDLQVPYHSRWRHFEWHGRDRMAAIEAAWGDIEPLERCRRLVEIAIISVLLDAGAGAAWRFHDPVTKQSVGRSEGLALASLALFQSGVLSADASAPFQVDGAALIKLSAQDVGAAFQVSEANPLVGLSGRSSLLQSLGEVTAQNADIFGMPARLGHLVDFLQQTFAGKPLDIADMFPLLLTVFADIWPGREHVLGHNLGDVWRHPALSRGHLPKEAADETVGLMPFHKLSQWLTYSLLEPFAAVGFDVSGADQLTGLAEYRNGGLLIDAGVLEVCDTTLLDDECNVADTAIVEWRALTVALIDQIAALVRQELGDSQLPLASILQGGTWAAGRQAAYERRSDGSPPIRVVSDGTVF